MNLLKKISGLVILVFVITGCVGSQPNRDSKGRLIVTVWHPWGGTTSNEFAAIMKRYERTHPNIHLQVVYTPNDLSNNQKFFTAVAAGLPPDVIFVDGPQVAEWADRGALLSMDRFYKQDHLVAKDFFPPCWRQIHYNGRIYAMTFCADPNFAFAWNKADFAKVGLNPNKPPKTIAEMDADAARLTIYKGSNLVQVGIIPWAQFGSANSLFTWGWAFGGSFYNSKTHQITANNPKIVAALKWMVSYAKKYNITKIVGLQQGFGSAQLNPFYTGQMAMECMHISGIRDIKRYAPNLNYGLSFIPFPPGGERHSSWVGGWCIAIPKGARHPNAAWNLIHWLCTSNTGTTMIATEMGLFPALPRSPAFKIMSHQPGFNQFYKILLESKHQRPVMPAQAYYMGALQRAVDAAIYGQKTPQQALDEATTETQAELDAVLAKH